MNITDRNRRPGLSEEFVDAAVAYAGRKIDEHIPDGTARVAFLRYGEAVVVYDSVDLAPVRLEWLDGPDVHAEQATGEDIYDAVIADRVVEVADRGGVLVDNRHRNL